MSGIRSRSLPLGDITQVVTTPFDPRKYDSDLIVNLYSFSAFDEFGSPVATTVGEIKSNKVRLPSDAVLMSRLNPHIPRVWRARAFSPAHLSVASTEFIALVPREGIDLDFLYFVCSDPSVHARMAELVTGTSGSHQRVRQADVLDIPVRVPPLEDQRRFGRILATVDAKARVARQLGDLGEEWASSRFHELVRKRRFPLRDLGDLVSLTKGVSYRRENLAGDVAELVTLKCVGRNGEFRWAGVRPYDGPYKPTQVLKEGDIAVAVTDLTQRADVLGRPIRIKPESEVDRVASLDLVIVRPDVHDIPTEWLYVTLRSEQFRRHARRHANGTTVLHLALSAFETFRIALPNVSELHDFSGSIRPFLDARDSAEAQLLALSQLMTAWRAELSSMTQ